MFLVPFVVAENVNTIEIRLIHPMRFIRATLLEYQPTSGFRFLSCILVGRALVTLTVETLPRDKLATRAIKNDVARNREFDLLAIDPTCRCR